jgi:hypothetical protein
MSEIAKEFRNNFVAAFLGSLLATAIIVSVIHLDKATADPYCPYGCTVQGVSTTTAGAPTDPGAGLCLYNTVLIGDCPTKLEPLTYTATQTYSTTTMPIVLIEPTAAPNGNVVFTSNNNPGVTLAQLAITSTDATNCPSGVNLFVSFVSSSTGVIVRCDGKLVTGNGISDTGAIQVNGAGASILNAGGNFLAQAATTGNGQFASGNAAPVGGATGVGDIVVGGKTTTGNCSTSNCGGHLIQGNNAEVTCSSTTATPTCSSVPNIVHVTTATVAVTTLKLQFLQAFQGHPLCNIGDETTALTSVRTAYISSTEIDFIIAGAAIGDTLDAGCSWDN